MFIFTISTATGETNAKEGGTISLAEGLPAAAPLRAGTASGRAFTVRALLHAAPGHTEYHLAIHRERYVQAAGWPR